MAWCAKKYSIIEFRTGQCGFCYESKQGMNIWEQTSLFVVAWCARKYLTIEFQAGQCGLYS